ncbi:MAG TPA: flagellar basal-body rod protein FlgG [Gammaproteobacteria bacterium]|nr:flagellar basal-body rod protein FlgG [Gammaproteobacteria bacterium]
MSQSLWIAKTGLEAMQTKMAVITNNLANVNTAGYKRGRPVFADLLYQNVRQVGAQSDQNALLPTGLSLGTGVKTVATEKVFTQGNVMETGNPLDLAVQGKGFFQILMPDGTLAYSRNGSFHLNESGQMVTSSGLVLQPAITIPSDAQNITIGYDGTVSVTLPGSPTPSQIGTIQLASFVNPSGLQPIGDNLYLESAASGAPQTNSPGQNGLGTLLQGNLETSNVNVVESLVNMIETQRSYEMVSKAIQATDRMMEYVNNNI